MAGDIFWRSATVDRSSHYLVDQSALPETKVRLTGDLEIVAGKINRGFPILFFLSGLLLQLHLVLSGFGKRDDLLDVYEDAFVDPIRLDPNTSDIKVPAVQPKDAGCELLREL